MQSDKVACHGCNKKIPFDKAKHWASFGELLCFKCYDRFAKEHENQLKMPFHTVNERVDDIAYYKECMAKRGP